MNKTILQFDISKDENNNLNIQINKRSFKLLLLTIALVFAAMGALLISIIETIGLII